MRSQIKKLVTNIAKRTYPFEINESISLQPFRNYGLTTPSKLIGTSEVKPPYSAFTFHDLIHPHLQQFIPKLLLPALSAIRISNAHIYTIFGEYIYDSNKMPISGDFSQEDKHDAIRLSSLMPSSIYTKEGTSVLMIQSNMWWQNYFHWTLDYLTKIIWARRILGSHQHFNALYITSKKTFSYQHDSLMSLGLTREAIKPCFYFGRLMHVKAADLLLIQERYDIQTINPEVHNNTLHPSIVNELASEVIRNLHLRLQPPKDRSPNRIYISRSNAPNRRLINEQEVIDYLARYNFKTVKLERLTFREQVEIFASSSIVIGVHGAGLTNIIYTQKCCVLELFASNHRHGAEYLQLTNIRQGFYLYHILDSLNIDNDLTYPLSLLSEHLNTMLDHEFCNKALT